MKRLVILFAILVMAMSGCQEELTPLQNVQLSENEISTLLFTREEEKLAHDVYTYAFEKYGLAIFQNIASSESQHVNAILNVLNTFQITDPLSGSNTKGEFTNPILRDLYRDLTNRVDISVGEAIKVGLLIEDMDIFDLENGIVETSNPQIISVYSSLKCGSENHLRSFNNQAISAGVDYAPEYISQDQYLAIISSARSSCQIPN